MSLNENECSNCHCELSKANGCLKTVRNSGCKIDIERRPFCHDCYKLFDDVDSEVWLYCDCFRCRDEQTYKDFR